MPASFPDRYPLDPSISNILRPPVQLRLHLHSFMQWTLGNTLQGLWHCHTFPGRNSNLQPWSRIHDPLILQLSCLQNYCHAGNATKFCCPLEMVPGSIGPQMCINSEEIVRCVILSMETFSGISSLGLCAPSLHLHKMEYLIIWMSWVLPHGFFSVRNTVSFLFSGANLFNHWCMSSTLTLCKTVSSFTILLSANLTFFLVFDPLFAFFHCMGAVSNNQIIQAGQYLILKFSSSNKQINFL